MVYRQGKRECTVRGGEVICCCGTINSPQLLQLSGIGAAGHLESVGIRPVADLPGVGEDLQDHLEIGEKPLHAALVWLKAHPGACKPWLAGVTTRFGKSPCRFSWRF